MQPFRVSSETLKLRGPYPAANVLRQGLCSEFWRDDSRFARLWISEGIPAVFQDAPIYYEAMREWLGHRINVHPKAITVVGSARIGYSLAPSTFGQPFQENASDLDLVVIGRGAYDLMQKSFHQWASEYDKGKACPRSPVEEKYWADNRIRGENNIRSGFIDNCLIPNFPRYEYAQSIAQTMYLLKRKLDVTEGAPKVKHASVRFYAGWAAFVDRLGLNLSVLRSRINAAAR